VSDLRSRAAEALRQIRQAEQFKIEQAILKEQGYFREKLQQILELESSIEITGAGTALIAVAEGFTFCWLRADRKLPYNGRQIAVVLDGQKYSFLSLAELGLVLEGVNYDVSE